MQTADQKPMSADAQRATGKPISAASDAATNTARIVDAEWTEALKMEILSAVCTIVNLAASVAVLLISVVLLADSYSSRRKKNWKE